MNGQTATASHDGQKSQPWKKFWPPQDSIAAHSELTPEEMNLQRSYGTHASNTKGKIFAIDSKPLSISMSMKLFCEDTNILPLQQTEWVGTKLSGLDGGGSVLGMKPFDFEGKAEDD